MSAPSHNHKSLIASFFPTPNFLKMKSAGMDIADSSIYLIDFFSKGQKIRPRIILERKLPEGVVVDGSIKKRDELISILQSIRKETGVYFVRLSFPDEKSYLFQIPIQKGLTHNEIQNFIESRLDENIPVDPREAVFDFSVVPKEKSESDTAFVCAGDTKEANIYLETVRMAGFLPTGLCPHSQAGAFAVTGNEKGAVVLLVFGKKKTAISIVENGIVSFTSNVGVGGDDILESIKKNFEVEHKEAQKIANDKSFLRDKKTAGDLFSSMEAVSLFKEEFQKIVSYWESKGRKEEELSKIILLGKNSSTVGFEEYVSSVTGRQTILGNVWSRVFPIDEYVPSIDLKDSLEYGSAIGLALQ